MHFCSVDGRETNRSASCWLTTSYQRLAGSEGSSGLAAASRNAAAAPPVTLLAISHCRIVGSEKRRWVFRRIVTDRFRAERAQRKSHPPGIGSEPSTGVPMPPKQMNTRMIKEALRTRLERLTAACADFGSHVISPYKMPMGTARAWCRWIWVS